MRVLLLVLLSLGALTSVVGCKPLPGGPVSSTPAGPRVVASIYPLAWVAERIVGPDGTVTDLTTPGQEPHDLELTVRQTAALVDADLIVSASGLQPAVDDAIGAGVAGGQHVEALTVLRDHRPAIGTARPEVVADDPHFWLDPRALATVAQAVADRLVAIDTDRASAYHRRAAALIGDLRRLDAHAIRALADCQRRTDVVSHAAFGYFGRRYDLDLVPIEGLSPDAEPSPKRLSQIADLARRQAITTVFAEELGTAEYANFLAHDLGLRAAVLDPIEGLSDETAGEDYLSLMRDDVAALREANGCR